MPNNWKTYKLKEVCEKIFSGGTPSTSNKEYWNGNIPWLSSGETGNRYIYNTDKFITEIGFQKSSAKMALKNDVVIASAGQGKTRGQTSFLKIDTSINQSVLCFRANKKIIDPKFLFFDLSARYDEFRNISDSYSTRGSLTKDLIENQIKLNIPPLPEQQSIASILSAIDDKIENNLAINKTLEEMAMALYKHWFVDFGPFQNGEFVESELGLIPKGWEVKKIGDVIETLGGGTPSTTVKEYWEDGEILWYSPTDLTRENSLFSFDTAKKITPKGLQKSSARLFPAYSILMSSRATIGLLTINTKEACTNQGFITLLPNDILTVYQLYFWVKHNEELILSKANGSTFKEISKSNFRDLDILIGKNVELYIQETKDIFNQIENNLKENQTLTQLRDTLLPKLISGEVRLKEFRESE
jgi:type I restriction enzyme, S subunit